MATIASRYRSLPLLLADLKRRRVFQTMAVYGATSFALLEALSALQPLLTIPPWLFRGVGLVVLLGFPVAVILTWVFDYDDGLVVTPPASVEELDAIVRLPRASRWPVGFVALGGVALLGASAWTYLPHATPLLASADGRPAVAVLPFQSLSPVPSDARLAAGLEDDVLLELVREGRGVRVISRASALRFRNANVHPAALADSLDTALLLEGHVQRSGDSIHVSARLTDVHADAHLWAGSWNAPVGAAARLAFQRSLAVEIADSVLVSAARRARAAARLRGGG